LAGTRTESLLVYNLLSGRGDDLTEHLAMKSLSIFVVFTLASLSAWAADIPPAEAFRVLPDAPKVGPAITPYLEYQTDMAWRLDDRRRLQWSQIRNEEDLKRVQARLREHLLKMIGGLPERRTPLNAQITGRIEMSGFHVEKLVYQSLPGFYVTALLYVPDNAPKKNPAVLVPSGHSPNGKAYYQGLCQRLAQRGYVVLSWDAVGQGERSQFWDAKNRKSRYNLICAEHAVLGNLAYLAGTNLARWEIWDGIRAVDYLLTRPEVDPERINIAGTSGGGFQAAHIAALDSRIKVAVPSCYITALPMRVHNRIFKDPDSDPEQDLYGMLSNGVDHAGLLLLLYPRPVFVAAAVLDFFPIEGTHQTFREMAGIYERFGHRQRIAMHEGYHEHQFSLENQEAAIEFLDRFNGLPERHDLPQIREMDDKVLQATRTGQVMLEYENSRSMMDIIRDYYVQNKSAPAPTLRQLYTSGAYPGINTWQLTQYRGGIPRDQEMQWELVGSTSWHDVTIERFAIHHGRYLVLPLLRIRKIKGGNNRSLLWLGEAGKATAEDWPELEKYLSAGYQIISLDPRGLGETRMPYKAASPDDPTLAQLDFDQAYLSPISGVLADYVYNSLLNGRPYFLQMIEDVEIAIRFVRAKQGGEVVVAGQGNAYTLASAVTETLPNVKLLSPPGSRALRWSELVNEERELWPVEFLLPGGAYVH